MEVKWEITKKENFTSLKKMLLNPWVFVVLALFFLAIIGDIFESGFSFGEAGLLFLYYMAVVSGVVIIIFIARVIFYRKRKYLLTDDFVEVAVGRKRKKYAWDDFELFLVAEDRLGIRKGYYRSRSFNEVVKKEREFYGPTIYLKKKMGYLFTKKVYVVLYTEADIYDDAINSLRKKLPQKEVGKYDFEGFVIYHFN